MSLQDDIARYVMDSAGENVTFPRRIAAGLEREKIIIDRADIEAVEILTTSDGITATERHTAGSGPEGCDAREGENPNWLWNHGINALALALHLEARESEAAVLERRRGQLASVYGTHINLAIDDLIKEQDARAAAEAEVARLTGGQS